MPLRAVHGLRSIRRRGATAVEMALVSPLLLFLLFGLFDLAHALMVQHQIQDAARQGCRRGVCPGTSNGSIQAVVDAALSAGGVSGASLTVYVNDSPGDVAFSTSGDDVRVQLTVPMASVSLFPGKGFLTGQLSAAYSLRKE